MTTLSPIDARFACICGGTSKQHPTTRGCEHCKECDYYRPARCVCHLTRDDGKTPRCYAEVHGDRLSPMDRDSGDMGGGGDSKQPPSLTFEAPLRPKFDHASHSRRSVNWLMHPGNCDGTVCGIKKIKRMAAQPEESHVGRNGRRLAEIYGVK